MAQLTKDNVVPSLLGQVPELRRAFPEEIELYEKEGLQIAHPIFGCLTSFVVDEFRRRTVGPGTPFERAMRFLEEAMGSDDVYVQNLIWVSFLENLHIAGEDFEGIKAELGPKLRETLRKVK